MVTVSLILLLTLVDRRKIQCLLVNHSTCTSNCSSPLAGIRYISFRVLNPIAYPQRKLSLCCLVPHLRTEHSLHVTNTSPDVFASVALIRLKIVCG